MKKEDIFSSFEWEVITLILEADDTGDNLDHCFKYIETDDEHMTDAINSLERQGMVVVDSSDDAEWRVSATAQLIVALEALDGSLPWQLPARK